MSPTSTIARLTFFVQPLDGVRAYQTINSVNAEGDLDRNFQREQKDVVLENLRGQEDTAILDIMGFQLIHHPAKYTSFANDAEIAREYYPESVELIKKVTGASRVVIFDHDYHPMPSSSRPEELLLDANKRQPVSQAHVDQTTASAIARVHRHLPPTDTEALLRRHFQIINLWRPINHPAIDWPLGLCDYRSVDPKEDALAVTLIYPNHEPGEAFGIKYNPNQKWKYFHWSEA